MTLRRVMFVVIRSYVIRSPALNPLLDPLYICLNVVNVITFQFNDNFFVVRTPSLFKQHCHDFAIQILLHLFLWVVSGLQPIIEIRRIGSQYNHQVDPTLGEEVACVPVNDVAPCFDLVLNRIQELRKCASKRDILEITIETGSAPRLR